MSSFAPEFSRFWLPHGEQAEEARDDDRDRREDDRSRQERALEELFERVNAARSVF